MRLIIIGGEYTGKTTLVYGIQKWIMETMGDKIVMVHDHFLPFIGEGAIDRYTAEEEDAEFSKLKPFALEKYMRYMIHYHLGHHFYSENDHLLVNWYYADAVYSSMYFGYGGPNEYADRRRMARHEDMEVMAAAPDTVLIQLTASSDVIRERMRADPRANNRFQEKDIETVLERFNEEFGSTLIRRRFTLDTSAATPAETLEAFFSHMATFWSAADRLRMLGRGALQPRG